MGERNHLTNEVIRKKNVIKSKSEEKINGL